MHLSIQHLRTKHTELELSVQFSSVQFSVMLVLWVFICLCLFV